MRILILTFYYEPDLSAGSFRNTALVNILSEKISDEDSIDVITTMPNRYRYFDVSAEKKESKNNISIHRIKLSKHKSGMLDQSLSFLYYTVGVLKVIKNERYDLVYASSSRLMTALLGCYVSWRRSAKLYLDIRDVFSDTMSHILCEYPLKILLPVIRIVEKKVIKCADKVNLISPGFLSYFNKVDVTKDYRLFTNGVDNIGEYETIRIDNSDKGYKEILYAGNIGDGQGLHKIIPQLAEALGTSWRITIIGDGGRLKQLKNLVENIGNVRLYKPIERNLLFQRYLTADVLFLHLNNFSAFENVLPSKLFEYAATNKPILMGASGCAANFAKNEIENVALFNPCDINGAVEALNALELEVKDRALFVNKYNRVNILEKMADDILDYN